MHPRRIADEVRRRPPFESAPFGQRGMVVVSSPTQDRRVKTLLLQTTISVSRSLPTTCEGAEAGRRLRHRAGHRARSRERESKVCGGSTPTASEEVSRVAPFRRSASYSGAPQESSDSEDARPCHLRPQASARRQREVVKNQPDASGCQGSSEILGNADVEPTRYLCSSGSPIHKEAAQTGPTRTGPQPSGHIGDTSQMHRRF